jgi:hypothetical protein
VFQHIKRLIKKGCLAEALAGKVPLCLPSVERILKPEFSTLQLVSGSQLAVQSVEVLFAWLWEWKEDCFKRKHWIDKPYRLLFQRSYEIISLVRGRAIAQAWRQKLRGSFIKTHWLLPYPQADRFMKSAQGGQVWWWSSYHPGVGAYYESQEVPPQKVPSSHQDHYPFSPVL